MQASRDATSHPTSLSSFPPAHAIGDSSPAAGLPRLDERSALFLDFDGTLVELATQPEAVEVPGGLTDLLARVTALLGGAVAVVSGRQLGELDHFLAPLKLPVAAEHGAQRRLPGTQHTLTLATPDLIDAVRCIHTFASRHAGLQVEVKSAAVALHYRHAPQLEAECLAWMTDVAESTPGVELLRGKFVFEIKPSGVSKGTAITDFMKQPPFKGRMPVFAGDDVTDEAGFAAVQAMGGIGIKVGTGASVADVRCDSPADVLTWLQSASSSAR